MTAALRTGLPMQQRRLVLAVLGAHLPAGVRVWVFGSRATGRARPDSDLDLAIDAVRVLTLVETARLADAFCESDLPYPVDIVDWHGVSERFRERIAAYRVPLSEPVG